MKLFTPSRIGNKHADLCMITADLCNIKLEEIVVGKDQESSLLNYAGPGSTLPILEVQKGVLITSSMAICRFMVESTKDNILFGESIKDQSQVD
jgi:glutaredoxin 2